MTTIEFIRLSDLATDAEGLQQQLENLSKPYAVRGRKVPADLNGLTMGELMRLQSISTTEDFILAPCEILLRLSKDKTLKAEASEVLGFSYWVAHEVKHINKLFASTSVPATAEEKAAGSDALNFGPFGLVDYYARRMGITDHEEVESVPWVRVYKCLDMDAKRMMFDRKLKNELMKKTRR